MSACRFLAARDELRRFRFMEEAPPAPGHGEVLVEVDRFAFTTNNVTYAQLGETLRYWSFFPAPAGWGSIPVWGFANVLESRHEGVARGERLYGFWPMATHALLHPGRVGRDALQDAAEHRRELPPVYNLYARTAADPSYDARHEDLQALFQPLFTTAFLLEDFLAEAGFFGARRVLVLSASAKTALSLAHQLRRHRRGQVEIVGITSARHAAFVAGLGCYDRVLAYEAVAALEREPALYVDFAGSSAVRAAVHEHLGSELRYACAVGISHGEARPRAQGLPGPKPAFFFAPERGRKRSAEWGREAFAARLGGEWRAFLPFAARAVTLAHGAGQAAVGEVYAEAIEGRMAPQRGHILSLRAAP